MCSISITFKTSDNRAAAAYYPNFCTKIEDNCTEPECFTGISGEVWKTLAEGLNFTYTIRKDDAWGSMSKDDSGNVTWTGMIGISITYTTKFISIYSHKF